MAALRASEELFRVFAQAMPNQVWAADASGRIDWLNRQVEDYFGSSVRQKGESWAALLHPDDRRDAAARWHHSVATGEIYETEFRLRDRERAQGRRVIRPVAQRMLREFDHALVLARGKRRRRRRKHAMRTASPAAAEW